MLLITFGTRPEYIKIKSLLDNLSKYFDIKTLYTGQHTTLLSDIKSDYTINYTIHNNNRLNNIIQNTLSFDFPSDTTYVLVQGDTTSALSIALSAFNHKIKIIHLEAGLRTHNIYDPYPEELNRQLISRIAYIHLCPTKLNHENLIKENITDNIFITGNTGLDNINKQNQTTHNTVLITMHRRDNLDSIHLWFIALNNIAKIYPDISFIYPMHPNPILHEQKHLLPNINIINPVDHDTLINLIKSSLFIISDSGGIQEESCYLDKFIFICRNSTERPEILNCHGILSPTPEILQNNINNYMMNKKTITHNKEYPCPFGSGDSWIKIKNILDNFI